MGRACFWPKAKCLYMECCTGKGVHGGLTAFTGTMEFLKKGCTTTAKSSLSS